ncbi:MAG: TrkH family potassium uptake protein [Clostridia bacterium]|nr:TrkH family potassium uptake protein [Clostridia bacterium]
MNIKMICRITALAVLISAAFMFAPLFIAVADGQTRNIWAYAITIIGMGVFSAVMLIVSRSSKNTFYAQEGFAATSISWIVMSLFGALPFCLSGEIPSYIDALFEIVSGFTTTGASILSDVEALSRCNLYWRSFSHWLGGMGMLVFILAVLPQAKKTAGYGMHLMRAESPGPSVGKLTPQLRQTAMILYGLYVLLTVICFGFLVIGGMPVFDSLCISFGTAGTGGFAVLNSSMAGYSVYLQGVVTVFMFLFGVNFSLYYLLLLGQIGNVFRNEELRLYAGIAGGSILLITLNIAKMYGSGAEAFRHAAFQVSSIMTTTGFASTDFEQWPAFSKAILFLLMFIGACAGSTGGGLKVSRVLLLLKSIGRTIGDALHPRRVHTVHMDGRVVEEKVSNTVNAYFAVYFMIVLLSFVLISVDGYSIGTNISAVTACFNNIGPGFEMVGATGNYGHFSIFSKLILTADMLLGRLEIFPILVLFSPDTWSRKR